MQKRYIIDITRHTIDGFVSLKSDVWLQDEKLNVIKVISSTDVYTAMSYGNRFETPSVNHWIDENGDKVRTLTYDWFVPTLTSHFQMEKF